MSYLSRRELKYASDEKDARIAQLTAREAELTAEVERYREALLEAVAWMETVEPELFRMDGGDRFDAAPLTIARNALEEG